ncbi:hypothetical protein PRUPE_1G319400 [Prunus persica]|uniref:Uncharacterized protein n=3 Tax=Prunus persica TaxID=3760 RepID=A0A251R6A3_PRUPE|nr:uncharacterized protein LOC109946785 isoform X1 [Prunus persica]ONI31553.1 hypothetical protein PRUPE_1G319400 [Prunus persica]
MGVSFQVAKTGTRYKPKVLPEEDKDNDEDDSVSDSQERDDEVHSIGMGAKVADPSTVLVNFRQHSVSDDFEVSFSLKLFQNGFSVGKATEFLNDIPEHLHPYDRVSETLFSAIECGWLPGDMFDGLPCKYVNGVILCEIQDYRGCFIQGRAANSTKKIPTVHRVLLHMRMENVVKDILSISDASWTYSDILEVESHILKALQPDLHLNPQPLQGIHSGQPLSKKVDLGIMWSWKKRKLSNASNTDLDFSNSSRLTSIPVNCATQSCSSLFGLSYQERGVTFSEHNVSTSAVNPQENNVLLENSVSNPSTSKPISKVEDSCNQSSLTVMTTSNFVSLPKRSLNDSNNDLNKPSASVLSKIVRCDSQAVQGPLLKKPKQEPIDSSYEQLTGSQTGNSLLPYLQWKNKLLPQRIGEGKVPHERSQEKVRPSRVINNDQTRRFQGISELQAGMATSNVKLEPDKNNFLSSYFRKIKEGHFVMDRMLVHSNLAQSQNQQSSTLFGDNIPADTSWKNMGQPVDKNIQNRSVTHMRKDLVKCQVTTHGRCGSASSPNINSLPTEVSVPAKQKTNSGPKRSRKKAVDSSASTSNISQPSELKVEPVLERFLKIQAVTERYGLHDRKCKLDTSVQRRPSFPITKLVAFQLLSSKDNQNWDNTSTDKNSLTECSMDWGLGMNRRVLTFLRQSHIPQENGIPIVDRKAQVRLVISEKLNEGSVEASVFYGIEKDVFSIDYPLLPAFTSTNSADLLATEFTTLMKREGYYLSSDHIEPTPLKADGGLSNQRSASIRIGTPSAGTIELPSSTLTPGISPSRLSLVSMQLPSQNIFSGGQSLHSENIWAALANSCVSKLPFTIAAQTNCMMPQVQELLNRRAYLVHQMRQRKLQQNEIRQSRLELGGSGTSVGGGMTEQGGRDQGLGNAGLGSFGNVTGMRSSTSPRALGGQMPRAGNVGQFNNLGCGTSGLDDSKPLPDLMSDRSTGLSSKLRAAEGQGMKALMSRAPVQKKAGHGVPMDISNIPNLASKLSKEQQLQPQVHQPIQQPQKDMVPPLLQHVSSPQSQVSLRQQFDQQSQVSQQLSPAPAPHQVNGTVGHGSPERSSQTHGSVGSIKTEAP